MAESMGEFADRLNREWLAGRALAIHRELSQHFIEIGKTRTPRRVQDLIQAGSHIDVASTGVSAAEEAILRGSIAQAQAMAETVLIAVALYLAKSEPVEPH